MEISGKRNCDQSSSVEASLLPLSDCQNRTAVLDDNCCKDCTTIASIDVENGEMTITSEAETLPSCPESNVSSISVLPEKLALYPSSVLMESSISQSFHSLTIGSSNDDIDSSIFKICAKTNENDYHAPFHALSLVSDQDTAKNITFDVKRIESDVSVETRTGSEIQEVTLLESGKGEGLTVSRKNEKSLSPSQENATRISQFTSIVATATDKMMAPPPPSLSPTSLHLMEKSVAKMTFTSDAAYASISTAGQTSAEKTNQRNLSTKSASIGSVSSTGQCQNEVDEITSRTHQKLYATISEARRETQMEVATLKNQSTLVMCKNNSISKTEMTLTKSFPITECDDVDIISTNSMRLHMASQLQTQQKPESSPTPHQSTATRPGSLLILPPALSLFTRDETIRHIEKGREQQRFNDGIVYLDGPTVYSCNQCRTHLTCADAIVSKSFHGRHGRAYLFEECVNVSLGPVEERRLITGLHSVCDLHCVRCNINVGWTYRKAYEASQKYKEGKYILEKIHLFLEINPLYDIDVHNSSSHMKYDRFRARAIKWGSGSSSNGRRNHRWNRGNEGCDYTNQSESDDDDVQMESSESSALPVAAKMSSTVVYEYSHR